MRRLALLCGLAAACGGPREQAAGARERPPHAVLALRLGMDRPFRPSDFVPMGDSAWLALDRGGLEAWRYQISGGTISARRVWTTASGGPERIVAVAATPDGMALMTSRGALVELGGPALSATARAHIEAPRSRLLALVPRARPPWWLLEERLQMPSDSAMIDSLVLRAASPSVPERVVWAVEKGRYASRTALVADFSAATVTGGSIVVGGATPPRLWVLTGDSGGVEARTVALTGGSVAHLSDAERARVASQLGLSRPGGGIEVPDALPTVVRAWPIRDGFLVQAAAGPRTSALDLYCRGAFVRRLLGGPAIADVGVLPAFVVVLRDATAVQSVRLQLYERAALSAECPR